MHSALGASLRTPQSNLAVLPYYCTTLLYHDIANFLSLDKSTRYQHREGQSTSISVYYKTSRYQSNLPNLILYLHCDSGVKTVNLEPNNIAIS